MDLQLCGISHRDVFKMLCGLFSQRRLRAFIYIYILHDPAGTDTVRPIMHLSNKMMRFLGSENFKELFNE